MTHTCLIGERLNSSNTQVRRIFETRDENALIDLARRQMQGGASFIDINASMLMDGEREALLWAARLVATALRVGISLDSPNLDLLLDVQGAIDGTALLNSFDGDDARLPAAFAAARDRGIGVVVMLKGRAGIPKTTEGRIEIAERTAAAAVASDTPAERLYFDPLITPLATAPGGMQTVIETIRLLKARLPSCHRIAGLSNVSFGLPMRRLLNRTLLAIAVSAGLDSVICDTTDASLVEALVAAEALSGTDEGCRRFLSFYRERKQPDR